MKTFDLRHTPFSYAGSPLHIGLEQFGRGNRLVYETTRRSVFQKAVGGWASHFFKLQLVRHGQVLDYHSRAAPHQLELLHDDARAAIVFEDPETLLVRCEGAMLQMHSCHVMSWCLQRSPTQIHLYDSAGDCVHHLRVESGGVLRCEPDLSMGRGPKSGAPSCGYVVTFEATAREPGVLAIRTTVHEQPFDELLPSFDDTLRARQVEYSAWERNLPAVPSEYRAAAEFAWHMLWNQRIGKIGQITRPAILMSRHWMHCVWSWDACFSAIGIAGADPKLAWDQVLLHFDHQLPNGQLPDAVHDGHAAFGWVKPPVQGWTILQLLRELRPQDNAPYLVEAYEKLTKWTNWWYTCRDFDRDGVCSYLHGNDSGWDNATIFDGRQPVESPDLSAYLVLQCECLAELATRLGKPSEADTWSRRASDQLERMLEHLWDGDRFVARDQQDQIIDAPHSTILRIPIILGRRLPRQILDRLLKDLRADGRFVTEWGLATEAINSPHYEPDGYWRGPMWAPPIFMVFDGLCAAGEFCLAGELARRFCDTCAQEPVAMFENFDVTSGTGLRCKAYSWTAAVFVRLAAWLEAHPAKPELEVQINVSQPLRPQLT